MAGALFIVNIPKKEFEAELNKDKITKTVITNDKCSRTSNLLDELKENKRFSTIKTTIETYAQDDDSSITISKCNSTDCLHKNDRESNIFKCKSENNLQGKIDSKHYKLKSPWSDIKQVIKPRKSKLKITTPGTGVDILASFHWDTPLETLLYEVIKRLDIKNATWNDTKNGQFWQVIFSLQSGDQCEELLQVLKTFGVGSRHQSSISVIPCALYYNSKKECPEGKVKNENQNGNMQSNKCNSVWSRFSSSVRARTNLAQVLQDVRAEAALTFDWLFLLVVAAFVAGIGLVENSTVILVASMLISPLMGPITAGTLGTAVRDRSLQQIGVTHELLGLFLSLVIGFMFGLVICGVDERYGVGDWPTYEMMSRCEIRSLWVGILVAIPSGAGVALAVLGDYTASLVGVAISASLLPPAVNAGLLWAMALVHLIFMDDDTRWTAVVKTTIYSHHQPTELAVLGTVSLCLTLVNIICIFLAGVAVYKVKEVCPLERRDISWLRAKRNRPRSSKNNFHKGNAANPWDIYNIWRSEQEVETHELKKNNADLVLTNKGIDVVTYRQNKMLENNIHYNVPTIPRNQIRPQTASSYISLDISSADYTPYINSDMENSNKSDVKNTRNSKYSFYSLTSEDKNQNNDFDRRATIIPSENYTVGYKPIVLDNKCYDV